MSAQNLQATRAYEVTPSDTVNIPNPSNGPNNGCLLYVGTIGDLRVLTLGQDDVTFVGFSGFLPVQVVRVFATNTNCGDIIALW
jgi:hypothetical protein